MSLTRLNRSAATLTKNRTEGSLVSISGMCVTCVDGCIGMCEIGKSAFRGTEVIYPQPFGIITAASEKVYPVDLSHFNIMGTAVGAWGVSADSDSAVFPAVSLEARIGKDKGLKLRLPFVIPGLGSTRIAKVNWDGLAIGSALSGTFLTIGENVCGMDDEVAAFNADVIDAFNRGSFKEFERHSRLGMVEEDSFLKRVEELRKAGAKYVFLKTGAYRPIDLARAVKFSSLAGIDMLTVDAAGGGTGMSPWRMMNEWGVPGVETWSLLYQYIDRYAKKGKYIPDIAIAGGFTFEDQIFKGLALGAPYFKLIGMARSPLAAAMVGKTIGKRIDEGQIPVFVERFGNSIDEIFVTAPELRKELGKDFDRIPTGALGVYTYYIRLAQGIRQLMAGNRKFALNYITRDDIAAITREAAEISGIPYVLDLDKEEVEKLLG